MSLHTSSSNPDNPVSISNIVKNEVTRNLQAALPSLPYLLSLPQRLALLLFVHHLPLLYPVTLHTNSHSHIALHSSIVLL